MRRSSRQLDGAAVSLFPFLAVLLCTMGALLVILVVIAEQARANAAREAVEAEAPAAEQVAAAQQLQWEIEQYAEARAKTAQQLENNRLELSHLEDHLRRLQDQVQELRAAAAALDADQEATDQDRSTVRAELEIIEAEIARGTEELAQARRRNLNRPKSYAIIPYEGPNQTRRRPIYIECRADSVILQPEGTVLNREDFEGPLGPGNPLAAALRASSEHLRRVDPNGGDPYPLFLVRPDGIIAFSVARAAIESWGPDFGYELVESDWELDFQAADPYLAGVQQQAVEAGRQLQERLVRAAPSQYGQRPRYRASLSGRGFVRDDDFQRIGGGEGSGGGESQSGFGGSSPARGSSQDAFAGQPTGPSGQSGDRYSGSAGQNTNRSQSPDGNPQGGTDGSAAGGSRNPSPGGPSQGGAAQGTPGAGGAGSDASGGAESAPPSSLADRRGRDWALKGSAAKNTPVTRPIRVAVRGNWLAVINKQGQLLTQPVAMPRGTESAIDEFVSTIWTHTDSWGIAGAGLYWRPVLVLDVDPSGMYRAQELRILLENSGMDIQTEGDAPR